MPLKKKTADKPAALPCEQCPRRRREAGRQARSTAPGRCPSAKARAGLPGAAPIPGPPALACPERGRIPLPPPAARETQLGSALCFAGRGFRAGPCRWGTRREPALVAVSGLQQPVGRAAPHRTPLAAMGPAQLLLAGAVSTRPPPPLPAAGDPSPAALCGSGAAALRVSGRREARPVHSHYTRAPCSSLSICWLRKEVVVGPCPAPLILP